MHYRVVDVGRLTPEFTCEPIRGLSMMRGRDGSGRDTSCSHSFVRCNDTLDSVVALSTRRGGDGATRARGLVGGSGPATEKLPHRTTEAVQVPRAEEPAAPAADAAPEGRESTATLFAGRRDRREHELTWHSFPALSNAN